MDILTFKMWEDAAANSAGGGGIDGIGVGDKGEPGVHMKKKKKKEKELKLDNPIKVRERLSGPGSNRSIDWERRGKMQAQLRSKLWKELGMKLKGKK